MNISGGGVRELIAWFLFGFLVTSFFWPAPTKAHELGWDHTLVLGEFTEMQSFGCMDVNNAIKIAEAGTQVTEDEETLRTFVGLANYTQGCGTANLRLRPEQVIWAKEFIDVESGETRTMQVIEVSLANNRTGYMINPGVLHVKAPGQDM